MKVYNSEKVVKDILLFYENTICNYNTFIIEELTSVLSKITTEEKIVSVNKMVGGVANLVYKVNTEKKIYIIKKYNHNYDFKLSNKLYKIYENNNIKVCRPINNKPILINKNLYNVFKYFY